MKFIQILLLSLLMASCVKDEQLDTCRNYSKLDYSLSGEILFDDEPITFDRWNVYKENNNISIGFTKYYDYKMDVSFSLRKLLINDTTFFKDTIQRISYMSLYYFDCDVLIPCSLRDDSISPGYSVVQIPNSSDIKIFVDGKITLSPWFNDGSCGPDTSVFVKMDITLKEN